MKLKETLTTEQTINLLNGDVVGFFPYLLLSTDSFYSELYNICLGYYMTRSGEKTISVTYERIKKLIEDNPSINKTAEQLIGEHIRSKFIDKWERIYAVLVEEQYNALNNRDYTERKTGNNKDTDTYNSTKGKTGNNTDVTTFDTEVENDGNTGTHETTNRQVSEAEDVYGFNSSSPVGDSTESEEVTETVIGDASKNTTHNLQSKTGTESKAFGIDESETHTGTDTTDHSIDETITRNGRDGSGAELINNELNLRNSRIFFDIIYADIDSVATLQIYI